MPFQTLADAGRRLRRRRLLLASTRATARAASSSTSCTRPSSRGIRVLVDLVVNHTSDRHPWFVARERRPRLAVPRLVRLGGQAAARLGHRHGLPRRAEVDVVVRARSPALVLPPLLRLPARPRHGEPARARGGAADHRLLAAARRRRLPDGRGAVRAREAGAGRRARADVVRLAARVPRVPAVARRATRSCSARRTSMPQRRTRLLRATATGCT